MMKKEKPILDLMVDIETLSTDRDKGLVLSVGIQSFTMTDLQPLEDFSSYTVFLPETCKEAGRIADPETEKWWHSPGRAAALQKLRSDMALRGRSFYFGWSQILSDLAILAMKYELHVWSKGIDFDFAMIESSLRDAGLYKRASDLPYKFYHKYDMRTIASIAKRWGWEDPVPSDKVPHNALEDCRIQIKQLRSAFSYLNRFEH